MNVASAMHVVSQSSCAGLRYLVEKEGRGTKYLATAWFLDAVNRWFDLLTSRHPVMALSKLKLDEYKFCYRLP